MFSFEFLGQTTLDEKFLWVGGGLGLFFNTYMYTEVPGYTSNNNYYMGFMCLPRKVVVVVVLRTTSILIHINYYFSQCIFLNSNTVGYYLSISGRTRCSQRYPY